MTRAETMKATPTVQAMPTAAAPLLVAAAQNRIQEKNLFKHQAIKLQKQYVPSGLLVVTD